MSKGNYRTSTVNERWGEGVSIHLSHGPMGIRLILIFYYFNVILLKSSRAPAPPPLLLFQTRLSIMKGPLFFRKEYLFTETVISTRSFASCCTLCISCTLYSKEASSVKYSAMKARSLESNKILKTVVLCVG